MIGFPSLKSFNFFFSSSFIFKEVEEEFRSIYEENNMGIRMSDYISSTCVGVSLMGYNSPISKEQIHNKGKSRTFHGSLNENRKIRKTLDISFSLRQGLVNYMILYRNIEIFHQKLREKNFEDIFFPPVYVFIYNTDGTIMYVWEYLDIQIFELPELQLRKDDRGGNNKEISLKIQFNRWKVHNKIPKELVDLNHSYKHDFK